MFLGAKCWYSPCLLGFAPTAFLSGDPKLRDLTFLQAWNIIDNIGLLPQNKSIFTFPNVNLNYHFSEPFYTPFNQEPRFQDDCSWFGFSLAVVLLKQPWQMVCLRACSTRSFYQGLMRALRSCPTPPASPTSTCSVPWLCRWSFRSELWRSGTVFDLGFSAAAWTRSWRLQMSGREIFSLVKGWESKSIFLCSHPCHAHPHQHGRIFIYVAF